MHIEYRVSERDYINATTLANRKRSNLSALEHFWPYLFALVWLLISFIPGSLSGSAGGMDDLYFQLAGIPIFILFLWGRRRNQRREYLKLPTLRLLQVLDLDAAGLRLVTTQATVRSSWDLYTKFAENESMVILYQEGSHNFLPITKSFLTSLQSDELRSLLSAYLPKA